MIKICEKCKRTMSYDPYFDAFVCRQCGNVVHVPKRIIRSAGVSRLEPRFSAVK